MQGLSKKDIIFIILTTIFSAVNMLVPIYFSMALSKVTFRNKKIGGFWFVIFLLLIGILALLDQGITMLFPYYLDLNTFNVQTMDQLHDQYHLDVRNDGYYLGIDSGILNIASCVYNVLATVALFFGSGYLIEKKIDL